MHQMAINIDQAGAVIGLMHQMLIEDFVIHGFWGAHRCLLFQTIQILNEWGREGFFPCGPSQILELTREGLAARGFLLGNTGRFTTARAQIVKLGAAYTATAHNFNLFNQG